MKTKILICLVVTASVFLTSCDIVDFDAILSGVDIDIEEPRTASGQQDMRVARIGDVILYNTNYGTYIKKGDADSKKIKKLSNIRLAKITASNKYFYVSYGKTVRVVNLKGKIVDKIKSCCVWHCVCGSSIFGYYARGRYVYYGSDWGVQRMEVTHYIDEQKFLNGKAKDISEWTELTGDAASVEGKTLFRQEKDDDEYPVDYYTETEYYDAYKNLNYFGYTGGKQNLGRCDTEESKEKYLKQIYDIMEAKEKNYCITSWQTEDRMYGICNVYDKSGFCQLFSKDLKYGFTFNYDSDGDKLIASEKYDDIELAYYDGQDWIIYRDLNNISNICFQNLKTGEKETMFESEWPVRVEVTDDVAIVYETPAIAYDEPHSHTNAVILK